MLVLIQLRLLRAIDTINKTNTTTTTDNTTTTSNASAAATNDATDFAITTGHAQGGYAYATGSFTTSIYRKEIAGEKFVAGTDLLQDPGTVYNTSVLSTWDAI